MEKPSPIATAKAVKNMAELDGMREAHLRDSVALATTFNWLEEEVSLCSLGETPLALIEKVTASLSRNLHRYFHQPPSTCIRSLLGRN